MRVLEDWLTENSQALLNDEQRKGIFRVAAFLQAAHFCWFSHWMSQETLQFQAHRDG
jgi:hypothetical protein